MIGRGFGSVEILGMAGFGTFSRLLICVWLRGAVCGGFGGL
jgi:hypothetical protein